MYTFRSIERTELDVQKRSKHWGSKSESSLFIFNTHVHVTHVHHMKPSHISSHVWHEHNGDDSSMLLALEGSRSRPLIAHSSPFRYELRGLLVIWNSMLAMFSIMGAFRTAPELIHVLRHHGLFHSVCIPR